MAALDWSQCLAVESVPDRRSGAWVFRDTRMPVATVFENLEAGSSIEEIIDQFHVTREQIHAVLEFAARHPRPLPLPFPPRMRILFDHGTPSGIAASLAGHEVTEARERGWVLIWADSTNVAGELL
jgi:uncharacterized protein (DUF433 family)